MKLLILLASLVASADVSVVQLESLVVHSGSGPDRTLVSMQGPQLLDWMKTQPDLEPAIFDRDAILVETDANGRQSISMYPRGRESQQFFASINKKIIFQNTGLNLKHMVLSCSRAKLREVDAQGIWFFDAVVPHCEIEVRDGLTNEPRRPFEPRVVEACDR